MFFCWWNHRESYQDARFLPGKTWRPYRCFCISTYIKWNRKHDELLRKHSELSEEYQTTKTQSSVTDSPLTDQWKRKDERYTHVMSPTGLKYIYVLKNRCAPCDEVAITINDVDEIRTFNARDSADRILIIYKHDAIGFVGQLEWNQ